MRQLKSRAQCDEVRTLKQGVKLRSMLLASQAVETPRMATMRVRKEVNGTHHGINEVRKD
jgi:hypothetical protein